MNTYAIVPAAPGYWIIEIAADGLRKRIERFTDEDAAVRRLRDLEQTAQARERRRNAPVAKPPR